MKRSFREIVELAAVVVFAVAAANGLLWVLGHFLRFIGFLGRYVILITNWLWRPILWILVVTILIILVYVLVRNILKRRAQPSTEAEANSSIKTVSSVAEPAPEASASSSTQTSTSSENASADENPTPASSEDAGADGSQSLSSDTNDTSKDIDL